MQRLCTAGLFLLGALTWSCGWSPVPIEDPSSAAAECTVSGGDHFREEIERGMELLDAEAVWPIFAARFESARTARFYLTKQSTDPRRAMLGGGWERYVLTVNRNGLAAVDTPAPSGRRWLLVDRHCATAVEGEVPEEPIDCTWMFEALLDLFRRPHRIERRSYSRDDPDRPGLSGTIAYSLYLDGGREVQLGLVNSHLVHARLLVPGIDRPLDMQVHRVETGIEVARDLFSPRGALADTPTLQAGIADFPAHW